jgi:hypothetical protein
VGEAVVRESELQRMERELSALWGAPTAEAFDSLSRNLGRMLQAYRQLLAAKTGPTTQALR